MLKLYHYHLCPCSRYVRLCLEEHDIYYFTQLENYWKPQKEFLLLNPAGHLPVLINEEKFPIVGANSCTEYFTCLDLKPNLSSETYKEKAEFNRLYHWFENIFKKEVLDPILYEKVFCRIFSNLTPNSENIRMAINNLMFHIKYLELLLTNQGWLINDKLTYIDLFASANLSVLDYLGLLDFKKNKQVKEWYLKIKSRPSFKTLLKDQIVGLSPDQSYKTLDT